jgi:hypothetical protein
LSRFYVQAHPLVILFAGCPGVCTTMASSRLSRGSVEASSEAHKLLLLLLQQQLLLLQWWWSRLLEA